MRPVMAPRFWRRCSRHPGRASGLPTRAAAGWRPLASLHRKRPFQIRATCSTLRSFAAHVVAATTPSGSASSAPLRARRIIDAPPAWSLSTTSNASDNMLRFHSLRVAEIHPDAEDAVGISLEVPPELCDEYWGLAGQHVVVRTEINDEETRRTYSLVNAPGEWPLRIVARVHPAGHMSRYLAEQLNAGDPVDILPPNGSFTPRRAGKDAGTYVAFAS